MRLADDNIEKLLNKMHFKASDETQKRILHETLKAHDKTKNEEPPQAKPVLWRIIMKSKLTKVAVAAVIIIAILVAISQFGGSIDMANVTWADVKIAFLAKPWVHLKFDDGRETWVNLEEGKTFYLNNNGPGERIFIDWALNLRYWFEPDTADYISESNPVIYKDGKVKPWQPVTAWQRIVSPLEEDMDVEQNIDKLNGKELIRFDCYCTDALGREYLGTQLWADPELKLPVRIQECINPWETELQERKYTIGVFDFPQNGPSDIYDIGVSRDLEVINFKEIHTEIERSRSEEVRLIIESGEKALKQFPTNIRTVKWLDKNDEHWSNKIGYSSRREIWIAYRNGNKECCIQYDLNEIYTDEYHNVFNILNTLESILRWTQTREPMSVDLCDGENLYNWSRDPLYDGNVYGRTVRVIRNGGPLEFGQYTKLWPYEQIKRAPVEIVQEAPVEIPIGCIALFDGNTYYFIDPEKDYICVKQVIGELYDRRWRIIKEVWFSDFVQLSTGHWYARNMQKTNYLDGKEDYHHKWNYDILILEDEEYPLEIFDGKKLLEDSKIITD
jgi:hypothetical protein